MHVRRDEGKCNLQTNGDNDADDVVKPVLLALVRLGPEGLPSDRLNREM